MCLPEFFSAAVFKGFFSPTWCYHLHFVKRIAPTYPSQLGRHWGNDSPSHTTPASSVCWQLWAPQPLWEQLDSNVSCPVHWTPSIQIWPLPCPNSALVVARMARPQPTSLHTTLASFKSQLSSHTVPQVPLWRTSTRPEQRLLPPTNLNWYPSLCRGT